MKRSARNIHTCTDELAAARRRHWPDRSFSGFLHSGSPSSLHPRGHRARIRIGARQLTPAAAERLTCICLAISSVSRSIVRPSIRFQAKTVDAEQTAAFRTNGLFAGREIDLDHVRVDINLAFPFPRGKVESRFNAGAEARERAADSNVDGAVDRHVVCLHRNRSADGFADRRQPASACSANSFDARSFNLAVGSLLLVICRHLRWSDWE